MSEPEFQQVCVRLRRNDTEWLVHPELRSRLVDKAKEAGTNMTEVVIEILSKRYAVAFVPNGRRTDPREDQNVLNLRLPAGLYVVLATAAAQGRRTIPEEIRRGLCTHYGLRMPVPPKQKRNRRPRGTAAAA